MAQNNSSIPILNNNSTSSYHPSVVLSSPHQEAVEQAKANANLLVSTLREIVQRQNELSRKVEFLEHKIIEIEAMNGVERGPLPQT